MAKKTLRIAIPENVEELLTLGGKIYEKHVADAGTSPLKSMKDHNWDAIGPNLAPALKMHNEAEELERKMKETYEARDKLMGDIDGVVRATRDVLKGAYSKSPQKLGEWGYDVFDTPLPKKKKGE